MRRAACLECLGKMVSVVSRCVAATSEQLKSASFVGGLRQQSGAFPGEAGPSGTRCILHRWSEWPHRNHTRQPHRLFLCRQFPVPHDHHVFGAGVHGAGSQIDGLRQLVADISPDGGRGAQARERVTQHYFCYAAGSFDRCAMDWRYSTVGTIVHYHAAAEPGILERRIVNITKGREIRRRSCIKRNEMPRVIRCVAAKSTTKKGIDKKAGVIDLFNAHDSADVNWILGNWAGGDPLKLSRSGRVRYMVFLCVCAFAAEHPRETFKKLAHGVVPFNRSDLLRDRRLGALQDLGQFFRRFPMLPKCEARQAPAVALQRHVIPSRFECGDLTMLVCKAWEVFLAEIFERAPVGNCKQSLTWAA